MTRWRVWVCRAGASFSLVFFLLTCTPVETWWMTMLEASWTDEVPPVVLVLGADEQAPGLIGFSTYLRLNYAVRFWRRGSIKTVVVSGGPPDGTLDRSPLAWSMRDYLLGHGLPAGAILVETKSLTTRENFLDSRALMESVAGTKGFLTSDFHSGRAARVSERLGLHWRAVPIPDARKRWNNWWERWRLTYDLAAESAKWIWYAWKGWI